ncbi:oxidoreductase [Rhodocollybia butyracea]|uniref:Oxidoreductase n=1 Tax=Rhodocollybia butyracea TaxID=206335 RepID=A0A9P5PSX7_9AGAR|nr:oxidoreductase [Rhodocollybia butyracea]
MSDDIPQWGVYMREIYLSAKGPQPLGTVVFEEIEKKAIEKLKGSPGAFLYSGGSAGTWSTYTGNTAGLNKFRIIPRMLVPCNNRDLRVTLFGVTYPSPVLLAPVGVQGIFTDEGEFAPARAASKFGIPFIMSSASTRSIEQVAQASGNGPRWYQLYWPRNEDVTMSLLKRAKDNGFTGLVVTLDTMSLGWRPHDLERSYLPFGHGVGTQVGSSDPAFMARLGRKPTADIPEFPYDAVAKQNLLEDGDAAAKEAQELGYGWLKEAAFGFYRSWEDVKPLRDNWEGPLLLKGIQAVEDAERAIDIGVDGIVVSNHGGRQLDGAIPSIYALENIMKSEKVKAAQKSGKFTVLFDSGIRTGSDIIKALALGAQAVLLGRPWVYGAAVAGQAGVEQVIKIVLADLDISMAQAGLKNIADVQGKVEILTKVDF